MKLDLLDFSSPNVGYEDNEGKDLCGCCRTYYVVSPEELAEAKEAVSDLYEALKDVVRYALYLKSDKVGEGNAYINRREIARAREALAKVEGEQEHGTFVLGFEEKDGSSCREHWLNTILGEKILEGD